jgi:hypothetical protein
MTTIKQLHPLSLNEAVRPVGLLPQPENRKVFYALPEGGCFQIPLPESGDARLHKKVTDPDWHFYLGSR